jgi:hypothetical protein
VLAVRQQVRLGRRRIKLECSENVGSALATAVPVAASTRTVLAKHSDTPLRPRATLPTPNGDRAREVEEPPVSVTRSDPIRR